MREPVGNAAEQGRPRTNPWGKAAPTAHDVALEVLLRGPLSRSDLARRLDLSPPTLSRLTKDLLRSDLFTETPSRVDPLTGRPTRPLDVVAESRTFIGVNLTEHAAHGVLTTIRAGVLASTVVQLPGTSPDQVVAALADTVADLASGHDVSGVGVSLGGLVVDQTVVARAPFFGWEDEVPLAEELAARTRLPVVVDNDVAALARLHAWFGIGRGADSFALLTLGIATGYALVRQGQVLSTDDAGLGLLGHLPLDLGGPTCPDGHRGCAQAMLSIASICAAVSVSAGRLLTYEQALQLASSGHPGARRVVADSARALGRLIGVVASTTVTEHVVLAGTAVDLVSADPTSVDEGIADIRPEQARVVHLEVEPSSREPWARGAATSAIRDYVLAD